MAHSRFIVIKCPACSERFDAERAEDTSFITCPACGMQMKISGTRDHQGQSARRMAPSTGIPTRRHQEQVLFNDLAARPKDAYDPSKEGDEPDEAGEGSLLEAEDLVIDEQDLGKRTGKGSGGKAQPKSKSDSDAGKAAKSSAAKKEASASPRSGIERRAAKLGERAAKLEERALKLAKLKQERERLAEERKVQEKERRAREEKRQAKERARAEAEAKAAADSGNASEEEEEPQFDKVEVRSSGERRRLRKAPKAKVPAPKGRHGKSSYLEQLDRGHTSKKGREAANTRSVVSETETRTEDRERRRKATGPQDEPEWESKESPNRPRRPEREPAEAPSRRQVVTWVVSGIVGLFVVVAGCQFILAQIGWLELKGTVPEPPPVIEHPADKWSTAELREAVEPVIEAFLSAESNEEALQYVRNAQKVGLAMKRHYGEKGFQPSKLRNMESCDITRDREFCVVSVVLDDFSDRDMFLELPDGEQTDDWLIDWESWVGYSEMRFEELRLRQPQAPVLVRCYLLNEYFYNFDYDDDSLFHSFKMFDHDRGHQLWAYVRKGSETFQQIEAQLQGLMGLGEKPVTVSVRFPEGSKNPNHDQVEITEFHTGGWLIK